MKIIPGNAGAPQGTKPVSLLTARLVLRQWRDDDVAGCAALCADPAVMVFLLPADAGWITQVRAHWDDYGFGQWAVELPEEESFIGVVGLSTVSYQAHFTPAVEVAWRLARSRWGRGYAGEAARAALNYGFGRLGQPEIVAVTVPANRRSRRLMERLGMSRDPADDFDHPRVPAGRLRRHVLYRLRNPDAGR